MIQSLEDARLRAQFKKFKRTGAIPEAIYAGDSTKYNTTPDLVYWAKAMLALEEREAYNTLTSELLTQSTSLKFPYIRARYKHNINPIIALYEEYQKALLLHNPDIFNNWIVDVCKQNSSHIIHMIETDIERITSFINRYKKAPETALLEELISKLNTCLIGFKLCYHSNPPS